MNNKPIDLDRRLGPVSQHAIDLPPRRRSSRPLCSSGGDVRVRSLVVAVLADFDRLSRHAR
jgi:hypothetical protein